MGDFVIVINAEKVTVSGKKEEQKKALSVNCPLLLFPYLQQHVTAVTSQTGLHPAFIQPIDFEGLFEDGSKES